MRKIKSVNPLMDFVTPNDYKDFILKTIRSLTPEQNVLDIGGGRGKGFKAGSCNYYVLDLSKHNDNSFIQGDITSSDLKIDKKFDVIVTKDTFEHILNPWDATQNILNLLVEGGLFFCSVPFNWRFHPSPYDAYRYTHQGLKYLFERKGGLRQVDNGYIFYGDQKRGYWKNKLDYWPKNNLHKDCVGSYYVGRRDNSKIFDISEIYGDFSIKHDIFSRNG
jgi:SAM-dependent methyltransferase